ncbi:MAG: peptide chain release factor N(5)-glutamine methyltransferase [Candidatus Nanopelagicales bacterium]|nr:peptide chain release factor N(5)-glutamine methyltransferase [Candidatus Nanopelagicales bacterium]
MSVRAEVVARLRAAGVPSPEADADHLIEFVLGRRAIDPQLTPEQSQKLSDLVATRCRRVPLQHLTGTAGFRYLDIGVGPGVFIPRPETEVLVDIALQHEFATAVDLCTGSGAIALSLATETHARVVAVEKDPAALEWAQRNVGARVELRLADVCADDLRALGPVDLVVSNPPYIPEGMVPRDPEVALHDPPLALFGGPDGLDVVRCVISQARRMLAPGGRLLIEHGELQAAQIRELLHSFESVTTWQDLTGRDRVTGGWLVSAETP